MHAIVLRYLDQVARVGSIRRAAEKLNVASSAVNRQILKLESEIGAPIFERLRQRRPDHPARRTTAPAYARDRSPNGDARSSRSPPSPAIFAARSASPAIPSLLVRATPRAMTAVAARYPNISFRVIDADPAEHVEEMRAARADIALTFIDKRHRHYEVAGRLSASLGAIMKADHPLAGRRAVTLTDCAAFPVIMLSDAWLLDAASESEFAHSGASFSARVTSNSLTVMKEAMKAGLGIGFFTPVGFVEEIAKGELKHVPLVELGLAASEIGLFVHRARAGAHHISIVAEELKNEFSRLEGDLCALIGPTSRG